MKTVFSAALIVTLFLFSILAAPLAAADHNPLLTISNQDGTPEGDCATLAGPIGGSSELVDGDITYLLGVPHGDYTATITMAQDQADRCGAASATTTISFTIDSSKSNFIEQYQFPGANAPDKPGLSATVTSETEVELTWTYAGTVPADGFKVLRDGALLIDIVDPTARGYNDTGLTAGTTYKYIVNAYNAAHPTGTDSNEESVKTDAARVIVITDFDFDDEVKPGETVKFTVELTNNGTVDLVSVEAKVTIENIDDNEDVEDTVDFGDLDAGKDEDKSVSLVIPANADDDTFDVSVEVEWKVKGGSKQSYTQSDWTIDVEKPKHQVFMTSVDFDKDRYEAGDTVQVAVSLLNTGANDETMKIKVSSDVGASAESATFTLDESAETTQYLKFTVPEETKDGKYFVVVSAAYGGLSAVDKLILEVAGSDADTEVEIVEPEEGETEEIPGAAIALGIIALILIALIVWFGKDLMNGKPKPTVIRSSRGRR